jgi:hypothetical protein
MFTIPTTGELVVAAFPAKAALLETLQKAVGGYIQIYPHNDGLRALFTAYVNEEGMNDGLAENIVGGALLKVLGFSVWPEDRIPAAYGPVVFVGKGEKALGKAQQKVLRDAHALAVRMTAATEEEEAESNTKKSKK